MIQLSNLLSDVERSLLAYPQVVGVGFGRKEIRGKLTNIAAWRVYVRKKHLRSELHHNDVIPSEVAGIATDVLLVQSGASVSGTNNRHHSTVKVGATVSNLKGVCDKGAVKGEGSGLGTASFLAALNGGTRGKKNLVLVSNRHVLLAHGAKKGDLIYQPRYTMYKGRCHFQSDALNPIAEILDEGFEGNYAYNYPGERTREYFIDCAAAQILTQNAASVQLPAMVAGSRGKHFKSIARAHELDVFAGRELRVHKAGQEQPTIGIIVDVMAPVIGADGRRRENNIVIRTTTGGSDFAEDGDSGALIVDHFNRAVGLLWGKSLTRKSEAFACHIHPVIARLNVTPLSYDLSLHC